MNPYPQDNSIIILDNCVIHKSDVLREVVEANGQLLIFLPPYSPDFNLIKESFSCGMYQHTRSVYVLNPCSESVDSSQLVSRAACWIPRTSASWSLAQCHSGESEGMVHAFRVPCMIFDGVVLLFMLCVCILPCTGQNDILCPWTRCY